MLNWDKQGRRSKIGHKIKEARIPRARPRNAPFSKPALAIQASRPGLVKSIADW